MPVVNGAATPINNTLSYDATGGGLRATTSGNLCVSEGDSLTRTIVGIVIINVIAGIVIRSNLFSVKPPNVQLCTHEKP